MSLGSEFNFWGKHFGIIIRTLSQLIFEWVCHCIINEFDKKACKIIRREGLLLFFLTFPQQILYGNQYLRPFEFNLVPFSDLKAISATVLLDLGSIRVPF